MKKFLTILIFFLFTNTAIAKDPCNNLPKPNIRLNDMYLENFEKYKNVKLGVGLTYSSHRERFSLFKYDLGYKKIDKQIFKKLSEMAYEDFFKVVSIKKEKVMKEYGVIKEKISDLLSYNILFLVEGDTLKFEFLSLGNDGNCVYKIRYTTNVLDTEKSIKNYKNLLLKTKNYLQETKIENNPFTNSKITSPLKTRRIGENQKFSIKDCDILFAEGNETAKKSIKQFIMQDNPKLEAILLDKLSKISNAYNTFCKD